MQPSPFKKNGKYACNPTGWYMSEKLDGMKGRWIGGAFVTRSGQKIEAPDWFIKLLPEFDVDGELYFGKNSFHRTGSLRSTSNSKSWEQVVFNIFDVIDYKLTWLERQQKLIEEIKDSDTVKLVRWKKIKSLQHLEEKYQKIVANFGEGIVLADPWGLYQDGHVNQILKYKAVQDCEAVIIGYRTDDNETRLASFDVHPINEQTQKPNTKITFNIGTGLKVTQRYNFRERFPIGTVVTYTYELMGKNGKPRTPVFKGKRADYVMVSDDTTLTIKQFDN